MRLMKLAREKSIDELLDAAFEGREKTVDNVCRLYVFVDRSFGAGEYPNRPELGSRVTRTFKQACETFLENAGVDKKELEKFRNPLPGEKGFRSVLEEFEL
jgi:hypothetical protein